MGADGEVAIVFEALAVVHSAGLVCCLGRCCGGANW
jgi:hypothetical protein